MRDSMGKENQQEGHRNKVGQSEQLTGGRTGMVGLLKELISSSSLHCFKVSQSSRESVI